MSEIIEVEREDEPEESLTPVHDRHLPIVHELVHCRGDLKKVNKRKKTKYTGAQIRNIMGHFPSIRKRYQEELTKELQTSGLHIAERILEMCDRQKKLFETAKRPHKKDEQEEGEMDIAQAHKLNIEYSKEISRLIAESKEQQMSEKQARLVITKENVGDFLEAILSRGA